MQGLGSNIKHYRNSPIMHKMVPDEYKPVLLANGLRRPFPKPTGELKNPPPWRNGVPFIDELRNGVPFIYLGEMPDFSESLES